MNTIMNEKGVKDWQMQSKWGLSIKKILIKKKKSVLKCM